MATGISTSRDAGFTLIELLVVVFIIGLLAGMVSLSVDWGVRVRHDPLRQLARIRAQLQLATDNALLHGHELGLRVDPHGYRLIEWRAGQWQPLALPSIRADSGWRYRWQLPQASDDPQQPDILLLPDGRATPFELQLSSPDGAQARLTMSAAGQMEVEHATH